MKRAKIYIDGLPLEGSVVSVERTRKGRVVLAIKLDSVQAPLGADAERLARSVQFADAKKLN